MKDVLVLNYLLCQQHWPIPQPLTNWFCLHEVYLGLLVLFLDKFHCLTFFSRRSLRLSGPRVPLGSPSYAFLTLPFLDVCVQILVN